MRPVESIEVRLERHSIPEPNTGCWLWFGATIKSAGSEYGVLGRSPRERESLGGSSDLAHRKSYEFYKGSIPIELEVDHKCSNTLCINPEHLQVVTHGENMRLGHERRYGNNCRRGHAFTPENTWTEKTGQKHCRKCHADREARKRAAKQPKNMYKRLAQAHRIKVR